MPLGFQRLNERSHRPNENINFIKPLATSSEQNQAIAKDFLERIAAQCYPIMKQEYISVMSLEEYAPNPEFLGRNFNGGEIIQLVLRDKSGRWLSFKFVQMVMMHELAHCKQMNHSRYFWQVRNKFAESMQGLWAKKYTGEGVWGRGQILENGSFIHDRMPDSADIPEHLCGGTYQRGRGRKRKRGQQGGEKQKLTYAEKQSKRITKKFGKHGDGHDLGEDELVRGALEQGKRRYGKPKVANSKRGRELRANAALARFEVAKVQAETPSPKPEDDSETESESSDDEYGDRLPILEKLGEITDQEGHHFFKVDEDGEDDGGEGAQDELKELQLLATGTPAATNLSNSRSKTTNGLAREAAKRPHEDSETDSEPEVDTTAQAQHQHHENEPDLASNDVTPESTTPVQDINGASSWNFEPISMHNDIEPGVSAVKSLVVCPICTMENAPDSPTCMACAHVLKPKLIPKSWRCTSVACKDSKYINSSDAGRCGLCGSLKPMISAPMGITSADTLRWDGTAAQSPARERKTYECDDHECF